MPRKREIWLWGVYLAVGSGYYYTNGGIGAKFLYNVNNRIRLAAEIDSWRKIVEDNTSVYNVDVYAHFLPSNRSRKIVIYPFVGIGREIKKRFDPNAYIMNSDALLCGGGIDANISPNLTLNCELRIHQVQFIYGGSLNLAIGLTYKL